MKNRTWAITLRDVTDYGFGPRQNARMRSSKFMEGRGTREEAVAQVLAHYAAVYPGRTYEIEEADEIDIEEIDLDERR